MNDAQKALQLKDFAPKAYNRWGMKVLRLILLSLAGALLVAQPALACYCAEDLLADAGETAAEEPACHGSLDTRHDESPQLESPGCESAPCESPQYESPPCDDCSDYEPAPASPPATAIASVHSPEFNPAPAIVGHRVISVRPQSVGNIGPPSAIPRVAPTPVLLKQRLLN